MTPEPLSLSAFLPGTVVPIEAVPDPVFSGRLMGDGIAIAPDQGLLVAPCAGRIVQLHASQHACTIETAGGARVLLHVGLDTVLLKGEGFAARVAEGQRIEAGQPLVAFDLALLARHRKNPVTVLVIENGEAHPIVWRHAAGPVRAGERLLALAADAPVPATAPAGADAGEQAHGWAIVRHGGGLHARPSALVAGTAKRFDAVVEIRAGGRSANARSTTALMGLGVGEGDEVELHARGAQAGDALEATIAALETVTAVHPPAAPEPQAASAAPAPARPLRAGELAGVIASPGLATGIAARLRSAPAVIPEQGEGEILERRALDAALRAVVADIEAAVAEAGQRGLAEQAAIFAAHRALAEDPELRAAADAAIAAGRSAAAAWHAATEAQCAALAATGQALLAERATDLRDIDRQVRRHLGGDAAGAALPAIPAGAVLLADDLAPSDIAAIERAGVAAIVLAHGGPTSHVAILARARGLPALVAVGPALAAVAEGARLVVDADQGVLETAPDAGRLAAVEAELARRRAARGEALAAAAQPACTADGVRIEVAANAATAEDAREAAALGAEAIGLLRTELLFLDRATMPTVDEQRVACQAVLDAMAGRTVIVRTLDVGADKSLPYIPMPAEENPALGLRGLRLSLARETLLVDQLKAILALRPLSAVRIMLPMVTDVAEVRQTRALLDRLAAEAGIAERIELGVMIETPAAAVLADQLAQVADFFSIGTNDLTQYALCMDRCNPALAPRLDGLHPAVLRLVELTARGAAAHGRWTGVCGAMASDRLAVPLLLGLGVGELSASAAVVPEIKALVRRLDLAECRAVAAEALALDHPDAIRALVRRRWPWIESAAA